MWHPRIPLDIAALRIRHTEFSLPKPDYIKSVSLTYVLTAERDYYASLLWSRIRGTRTNERWLITQQPTFPNDHCTAVTPFKVSTSTI